MRGANAIDRAPTGGGSITRNNTLLYCEVGAHGSVQPGGKSTPDNDAGWAVNEYNITCRPNSGSPHNEGTGGLSIVIGDMFNSTIIADTTVYPTIIEGFPTEVDDIREIKPLLGAASHWGFGGQKIGAYERSREIWVDKRVPGMDGWPTAGFWHREYDPTNSIGTNYTGAYDENGANAGAAPSVLTISEPLAPTYDTDRFGTQFATFGATVTHDVPGVVIQYRIFDHATPATTVVDWTDVTLGAGSSTDIVMLVPEYVDAVRAEIRGKFATGVTATQSTRWYAGNNVVPFGQSLMDRTLKFDIPGGVSFTPTSKRLWMLWNDTNGGSAAGPQVVDGTSGLGLRRMAAVFAKYNAPRMTLVNGAQNSTGRDQLLDDGNANRDWAASFANPIVKLRSLGTDVCAAVEYWFTNEAAVRLKLERHVAPGYLRQVLDGLTSTPDGSGLQPYSSGTINVGNNAYSPDHFLWDMTGGGQGIFDAARTKWVPWYGASFKNGAAVLDGQFSSNDIQKADIQAALRDMVSGVAMGQVSLNSVAGWAEPAAFGGHLAMPGGTHVAVDIDGESLVAVYFAHALLRLIGVLPREEPRIVAWRFGAGGVDVEVDFSLPHGNNLSTAYVEHTAGSYAGTLEASEWVTPSVLPETSIAELHNVQGFSVVRSGNHSFRDFTATITNTGSGTGAARVGTVTLTPSAPFASGSDGFAFGYIEGYHLLSQGDVNSCRPQIHMPLETRAHASGTGYGYPALREPNTPVIATAP
ncbi:MAG: hypothetical protein WBA90_01130 [Albidovulum sp.]